MIAWLIRLLFAKRIQAHEKRMAEVAAEIEVLRCDAEKYMATDEYRNSSAFHGDSMLAVYERTMPKGPG